MNFSRALFLSLGMLAANVALLPAEAAFFNLRGPQGVDVDGMAFGSTTVGGIIATLTASSGMLNQSGNGFGVNNLPGAGDDPDVLDGVLGTETITLTFNVDVFLDQIQLSVLSAGEEGSIAIAGGIPISLTDTGVGNDEYNFNTGNSVLTSESIVLSWVSGNGFSFDDFSVFGLDGDFDADGGSDGADFLVWQRDLGDATSLAIWEANFGVPPLSAIATAVPEPSGSLLTLLVLQGLLVGRRRRTA
ncbi:MAG: PEP-CTERM sorting domain-containing protein [Planctomycetes bacterium]|nr:PEP-CTERM sorting domain-containing protein [Planctomycetota bacterium]